MPSFWQKAFKEIHPKDEVRRERKGLVFFMETRAAPAPGYSHDLRQRYSMFCDPRTTRKGPCTPYVYGCRKEFQLRAVAGGREHLHAFPELPRRAARAHLLPAFGDPWSSRVLDAVVHGCIPVVVQDESEMFFEGAFAAAGLPIDYANFSIRLAESDLHKLVDVLRGVSRRIRRMRRNVLWLRDYFVYMFNPSATLRSSCSTPAAARGMRSCCWSLREDRARKLGRLRETSAKWRERNLAMLGAHAGSPPTPWMRSPKASYIAR